MEYKTFATEVKQIEDRVVTGLAAITGNVDDGGDRLWKGAFKKTIQERAGRVKHLWMHDPFAPPTAAIKDLREVDKDELPAEVKRKYPEATGGLLVAREYLRTPRGDEILAGIQAGAIAEMSFGYDPVKFDFEGEGEEAKGALTRNLREVRLWDTSDVTWGMNAATVASKRDRPLAEPDILEAVGWLVQRAAADDTLRDAVPALRRHLTGAKAGRVLSARNLEKLKNALTVLQDILLAAEPPDDEEPKRLALTVMRRLQLAERESYLYRNPEPGQ